MIQHEVKIGDFNVDYTLSDVMFKGYKLYDIRSKYQVVYLIHTLSLKEAIKKVPYFKAGLFWTIKGYRMRGIRIFKEWIVGQTGEPVISVRLRHAKRKKGSAKEMYYDKVNKTHFSRRKARPSYLTITFYPDSYIRLTKLTAENAIYYPCSVCSPPASGGDLKAWESFRLCNDCTNFILSLQDGERTLRRLHLKTTAYAKRYYFNAKLLKPLGMKPRNMGTA